MCTLARESRNTLGVLAGKILGKHQLGRIRGRYEDIWGEGRGGVTSVNWFCLTVCLGLSLWSRRDLIASIISRVRCIFTYTKLLKYN
jgi:hypothetical protein